jgi:hypothetical protein
MIRFEVTITQVGEGPECIEQHCTPQEATQTEQTVGSCVAEGIRQTMEQIEGMLRAGGGAVQSVSGPSGIIAPVIEGMKQKPGSRGGLGRN